jgi:hypothetical protein
MTRTKTPLLAALFMGLCGAWMASCSDDDQLPCVPNETRLCACADRDRQGVEACLPDGSGWGACDCSGEPREGAGGTSGEDPGALTPLIGRACQAAADCGAGLECFTASSTDFLGGGAPNGYCSAGCSEDADCTSIDRQSQCVTLSANAPGVCIRTCLSMDPTSLAENKCLGRFDVACQSPAYQNLEDFTGIRQTGGCYPQCASDDDCPGRRCDPGRGVCADSVAAGLGLGEKCARNEDCATNVCVGVAADEAFCSAPCVFGQPIGCGFGLSPATPRGAGCFTPAVQGFLSTEGEGDVGLCFELCSEASECTQAGWTCVTSEANQARLGRPGVCFPPEPADAGADGGSDGGPVSPPEGADASVANP